MEVIGLNAINTFKFNSNEVQTISNNGEIWFKAQDVCQAVGIKNVSKAVSRIDNDEFQDVNLTITSSDSQNGGLRHALFISESGLYHLLNGSRKPQAKPFQRWVNHDVLPEIRKNGMYVSDTATDEQKQFNYNMINVTFANCALEKLKNTYEECIQFHKKNGTRILFGINSKHRKDAHHTKQESLIMIYDRIEQTLERRRESLIVSGDMAVLTIVIDNVIKQIKDDRHKQIQLHNRGKLGAKTRQLFSFAQQAGKLANKYTLLNPPLSAYQVIPVHGFSNNYMTTPINTASGAKFVMQDSYRKWINNFPDVTLPDNIDYSKPIDIFLQFDCLAKFDAQNLAKTVIDQLINRVANSDDNHVTLRLCRVNNYVNSYQDGKIYFLIQQSQECENNV